MDREAWHAAIHGVTKSRTRLSNWTELNWTDGAFFASHTLVQFVPCFSLIYFVPLASISLKTILPLSETSCLLFLPIWDLDFFHSHAKCHLPQILWFCIWKSFFPALVFAIVFGVDLGYSLHQPSSVLIVCYFLSSSVHIWVLWGQGLGSLVLFVFGHRACYIVKTESRSS